MVRVWQVLCLLLTAVDMGLALAHALEFPGKSPSRGESYRKVRSAYANGFAQGGVIGEAAAIFTTLILLALTPVSSTPFWLTFAALVCMVIVHGIFWLLIQPGSTYWREQQRPRGADAAIFRKHGAREASPPDNEWLVNRDRWEYSHLARAAFSTLALVALTSAVAIS